MKNIISQFADQEKKNELWFKIEFGLVALISLLAVVSLIFANNKIV